MKNQIVLVLMGILLLLVAATMGGTIVWAVWDVVPEITPKLVELGYLPRSIEWLAAVKLSFLTSILLKSSNSNTK